MSYITTQRFRAGATVPRYLMHSPQVELIFAQDTDVVIRSDKHVFLHPVVHPAFRPDFQCGPLITNREPVTGHAIIVIGSRACRVLQVIEEPLRGFEEAHTIVVYGCEPDSLADSELNV
jgi:hypothetical protein